MRSWRRERKRRKTTGHKVRYYYLTGSSRGIGRCLALELLAHEDATVIGISRGQSIEHPRYRHHTLDFTDLNAVSAFAFEVHADAAQVALINNAGFIQPRLMGRFDPRYDRRDLPYQCSRTGAPDERLPRRLSRVGRPPDLQRELRRQLEGGTGSRAVRGSEGGPGNDEPEPPQRGRVSQRCGASGDGRKPRRRSTPICRRSCAIRTTTSSPTPCTSARCRQDGMLASPEAVAAKLCRVLRDPSTSSRLAL